MIHDVVVDTNVLMHADNPNESRKESAANFLVKLHAGSTLLCVDTGFHMVEAQNRSVFGSEYWEHLVPGNLAYYIVMDLASTKRLSHVKSKVHKSENRKINRLIPKPHDRIFLKVAINSSAKVFVSHDFADFPLTTRATAHANWAITICDSAHAETLV